MLNTDRRSLFAGSAAAAVAVAIPASARSAPADRRAWEHALARLEAVNREHDDFAAKFHDPAYHAEKAFEEAHGLVHRQPDGSWNPGYWDGIRKLEAERGTAHRIPDHIGERMDDLGTAISDAECEVMDTPAPDLAALRWKIDRLLVIEHLEDGEGGSTPCWSGPHCKQTLVDIARLLPPAA